MLEFAAPRRGRPPLHFADLAPADRGDAVGRMGQPGFRAKQLAVQYFGRLTADPDTMTDIPAAARAALAPLQPPLLTEVRTLAADGGTTRKALWRLRDGALMESVLMRYPDRATVCISSQSGCLMAVPFCATGQAGLTRNLSPAEIVDQVVRAAADMRSGVVPRGRGATVQRGVHGDGEPLANYRTVVKVLHRLADPTPDGLGLSSRNINVSTVGLVPRINDLAAEGLPVRLAASLHAPDDELRELVPVNTRGRSPWCSKPPGSTRRSRSGVSPSSTR